MTIFLLAFMMSSALFMFLIWLSLRRVLNHLKYNQAAQLAVLQHILTPMFGRDDQAPVAEEEKPCG